MYHKYNKLTHEIIKSPHTDYMNHVRVVVTSTNTSLKCSNANNITQGMDRWALSSLQVAPVSPPCLYIVSGRTHLILDPDNPRHGI